MSYAEDFGYDIYWHEDLYNPLDDVSEDDKVWVDKYGTHHRIIDMDYLYVLRCKNYCIKNNSIYPKLFDTVIEKYETDDFVIEETRKDIK